MAGKRVADLEIGPTSELFHAFAVKIGMEGFPKTEQTLAFVGQRLATFSRMEAVRNGPGWIDEDPPTWDWFHDDAPVEVGVPWMLGHRADGSVVASNLAYAHGATLPGEFTGSHVEVFDGQRLIGVDDVRRPW